MAGIEKYYEITEVYAWQWEGNTNITIEDIPEEIRNEVTMLKVERSIKTSFTKESNQLFLNYKGYQYNLFPGDFLIFEYNEFIDGFHFICVERGKDSLKKYKKCNSILFLPTSKALDSLNPKDAIEANAINFFNESCQALGILVDLNKKRLATCKKCGKTNKDGKKCNDVKEYCRKYLINLYGESIYSKKKSRGFNLCFFCFLYAI